MSRVQSTALRTAAQYALIDLRKQLAMSQQDLAVALGTTTRSVARWETAAFPRGRIVKRLEQFATKRGLTEHAGQFRRLLKQEQFLNANRKFFMTSEGLDLQVAIAKVRASRNDPKTAHYWAEAIKNLSAAVWRVLNLPVREGADAWEVEELCDLHERLSEYAKRASEAGQPPEKQTKSQKHQISNPKKRKPT
jgi:transcriptional regulator with XRE-family HTH domain